MFGFAWHELVVIGIVALAAIGPKHVLGWVRRL